MPSTQSKIPRGRTILIWFVIALLLVLYALVELARGFQDGISGLLSGW
jgi:hypothetical protein